MLIVVALSAALLTTTAWKEGTFLSAPVRPTAVRFAIGHQGREPTRMGLGPGLNHATAGQSAGPKLPLAERGRGRGAQIAPKAASAVGGKGADAPMDQSREVHWSARPLHSPEAAERGSGQREGGR
jgi:hypothetical protein